MKRMIIGAAVALGALTATPALAGSHLSIGFFSPAPVVYQPAPVYYQPPVVYYPPVQQVYFAPPRPAYYGPRYYRHDHYRDYGRRDDRGFQMSYSDGPRGRW